MDNNNIRYSLITSHKSCAVKLKFAEISVLKPQSDRLYYQKGLV